MTYRNNTAATTFGFETKCIDEAAHVLSSAYAPVTILPSSSTFDLEVRGVSCGDVTAYRTVCESGLTFQNEVGFDGYNLAVPLVGGQIVKTGKRHTELEHAPGRAMMVDGIGTKSACFLPGLKFKGVSLSTDLVHACLTEISGKPITRRIVFSSSTGPTLETARFMLMLADSMFVGMEGDGPLAEAPLAITSLNETLARTMLYGVPHSYSDWLGSVTAPSPSPRSVDRAIEYMRVHANEQINLNDIAQVAGTSARSLQEGFRRYRSTTPLLYLREIRLQRVREDLLSANSVRSVSQVAMRWGFTHMGLFSSYYRTAFGETPRQTLTRSRQD